MEINNHHIVWVNYDNNYTNVRRAMQKSYQKICMPYIHFAINNLKMGPGSTIILKHCAKTTVHQDYLAHTYEKIRVPRGRNKLKISRAIWAPGIKNRDRPVRQIGPWVLRVLKHPSHFRSQKLRFQSQITISLKIMYI